MRAALGILADLEPQGLVLGDAYTRALTAAASGGRANTRALLIAALEAGRQATRAPAPGREADAAIEIETLDRFRAAGREFEPGRHYRLTALELAEVEWRATLEPAAPIFRRVTR